MILYHGTNVDFESINLEKSHKYKDFGQGFYLTDIRSQAEQLAAKKAKLFGRYEEGTLTIDDLSRELTYKELNSQFFFGTEKSLNYLKRL